MQAILSGKLSILVFPIFLALIVAVFVIQYVGTSIRRKLDMAEYELERGPIEEAPKPPSPEDLLPGYTMLTKQDYDEIYESLKCDMLELMKQ